MKLSEKAVRIATEIDQIKEFYNKNQIFSTLLMINAIGWLVAGFGFFFVGITILVICCFAVSSLNIFAILYSRNKKKED